MGKRRGGAGVTHGSAAQAGVAGQAPEGGSNEQTQGEAIRRVMDGKTGPVPRGPRRPS